MFNRMGAMVAEKKEMLSLGAMFTLTGQGFCDMSHKKDVERLANELKEIRIEM